MSKKMSQLDKVGNKNPFTVPENYFDNIAEQVMANLPDQQMEEEERLTLWNRVKPWLYMAAMFAGIALMLKIFVGMPDEKYGDFNLTSAAEMEEFYLYYEEQLASNIYRETVYLGDLNSYEPLKEE
ncbi:hypothetical protein M2138_001916 [Dysgonomonadaceae bacterium PH5-43]|nr:hypothetical protein [Dysgonomonadaceae bacterium PH5-43]